jgi:hypothetical protein
MRGIRRGRYDNLRRIQGSDPATDYLLIHQLTLREEFPWDMRMAFNLAFNRSFALPRVAERLVQTGRVLTEPRRRADDTGIIMYEILLHGFEHPRGRLALRLLNEAHRHVAADNDDSVYVLAALVVVPMRWLRRYGWRAPAEQEREAAARYYREVGLRMGVRDLPTGYGAFEEWFDAYETKNVAYGEPQERTAAATRELFVSWFPSPLAGPLRVGVNALLDGPIRESFGFPAPPRWVPVAADAGLRARARVERFVPPRRKPLSSSESRLIKSYPNGYRLTELGPTA